MTVFSLFACLVLVASPGPAGEPAAENRSEAPETALPARNLIWYDEPARRWTEALPVGNGRLGAMVFGGVDEIHLQLNEESVWAGPPVPEHADDLTGPLAEARELFFAGKPAEGERLIQAQLLAPRISPRSHQTLGDLHIRMHYPGREPVMPIAIAGWRRGTVGADQEEAALRPGFDAAAWPLAGEDLSIPEHSTVVFRAEFELTDAQVSAGGEWELHVSPIDDASVLCLNGRRIGETSAWNQAYQFDVTEALQPGRNLLAIAARNVGGPGHMAREVELRSRLAVDAYRRELDLGAAIAATSYEVDGVGYRYEVFATPVDDVLVLRLETDQPGAISCDLTLSRPVDATVRAAGACRLLLSGRASHGGEHLGTHFQALLWAKPIGGESETLESRLQVRGADALVLLLAAGTDYNAADPGKPDGLRLARSLRCAWEADSRDYLDLRRDHVAAHQHLFERVALDLGPNPHPDLPTDERLERVRRGETDPNLEALYFQFGRYLLISSSRPGCLPANLQGIWNEHVEAPWNADYHVNINLQMNYWPAEVTNLSECHLPLFDFMQRLVPDGQELARKLGCRGMALGHVTDVWHWAAVFGYCQYGMWPMGAGWLSAHPMEHFRFTGDAQFLRDVAYPLLQHAALFYLDWLVRDPQTGLLVSGPTTSPENAYRFGEERLTLSMGTSMDQQIIWETFTNTLEAAAVLGVEDDFTAEVRAALADLDPSRIGSDGRIMEWARAYDEAEPGHRHMSHLYGLHPGFQFTWKDSPEFVQAARETIEARLAHGGGHTGWSRAWLINFAARLCDGDFAHEQVRLLLAKSTHPNLFDNHPPFQIDGNFGGTAGIAEMLLQSHAGEIHLLPALPRAWQTGNVRGLCARGGFVVDLAWRDGALTEATIHSRLGGRATCRSGEATLELRLAAGESRRLGEADFQRP